MSDEREPDSIRRAGQVGSWATRLFFCEPLSAAQERAAHDCA